MNVKLLRVETTSADGTSKKYLLSTDDGHSAVEIAFLRFDDERAICASAQVGCPYGCRHCATTYASFPYIRNLSGTEIIALVRYIIDHGNNGHAVDVLDFSGVGDCSANWPAVRAACTELFQEGYVRRYTLTSVAPRSWCTRVVEEIAARQVAPERIAISLHGADQATRRLLIPHAEDPWEAAAWWRPLHTATCRVVLNYVLHLGNSSQGHLETLARYLHTHAAWIDMVRISVLNPVHRSELSPATNEDAFLAQLQSLVPEVHAVCFSPLGQDIRMACGQMRAQYQQ